MFTLATILAVLLAITPAEAEAKSIKCPKVVTMDIKNLKNAIKSCDTMYINRSGNIKKVPYKYRKKYKYNRQTKR